jgi:hypothetical protein
MRLAFLQKFHRLMASRCQCCLWGVSALLKACESFKEKALFCYRISAARNETSAMHLSVFRILDLLKPDSRFWLMGKTEV